MQLHAVSPTVALTTLARFFSFASLEVVRFVGFDNETRLTFFQRNLWLVPLALVVDSELFRLDAMVRWLDAADVRLAQHLTGAPPATPGADHAREVQS